MVIRRKRACDQWNEGKSVIPSNQVYYTDNSLINLCNFVRVQHLEWKTFYRKWTFFSFSLSVCLRNTPVLCNTEWCLCFDWTLKDKQNLAASIASEKEIEFFEQIKSIGNCLYTFLFEIVNSVFFSSPVCLCAFFSFHRFGFYFHLLAAVSVVFQINCASNNV